MHKIVLFVEDTGHKDFLEALIWKFAQQHLLWEAVRNAGIDSPLGGIEYIEALVNVMDLEYLERTEESLGRLLKELRQKFQEWEQADHKGPRKIREDESPYDLPPDNRPASV